MIFALKEDLVCCQWRINSCKANLVGKRLDLNNNGKESDAMKDQIKSP